MPLTLTASKNVFPKGKEKEVFKRLSEAMLELHGLKGNEFMTPNVVGSIHIVEDEFAYSGNHKSDIVFIEWKVPSFAFSQRNIQTAYVEKATQIVHEISERKHPKNKVWVNVVHAVDGVWGISGKAMTNEELIAEITKEKTL